MKIKSIFRLIALAALAGACAPAYIPNVVNTPQLTEKHDLNIALYTGTAGLDLQGSFAFTDNIGLMVNGTWADNSDDSSSNFHKHSFFEVAPGYFSTFGNSGIVEIYGGYGSGWVNSYYDNGFYTNFADARMDRFFIQPGVGAVNNIFDGSLTTRVVLLSITQDKVTETAFFFEPVLTGKVGYKWVKFVAQMGFSIPVGNKDLNFEYQPFMFSVGMQLSLGKIFKSGRL